MCKVCWVLVSLLLLSLFGMAYKFLIQGSAVEGVDNRMELRLEASERELVLGEMRGFLASVQQIVEGITEDDLAGIAEAASKAGSAARQEVPASLVGKLPLAFKKLGFDTHAKFDQLALDAKEFGDTDHALRQLSLLMQNCVACHASYRIATEIRP